MKTFEGLMGYVTGPHVSDQQFMAFTCAAADRGLTLRQYVWQRVLVTIRQAHEVQSNPIERRQRWASKTATFRIWS